MQPKTTAVQTKKHARTEDAGTTDEAAATFEDMCKRAKTTLPKQTSIEPPVVRAHKRCARYPTHYRHSCRTLVTKRAFTCSSSVV